MCVSLHTKRANPLSGPSVATHLHQAADMSNSIAVPLVLLFFKVLLLPLIIAKLVLKQLVLQLILESFINY